MAKKYWRLATIAAAVSALSGAAATAGPLAERAEGGESITIGFAAEPPFAYPGEGNEALGFANAIAIGVLEEMGYSDIEPVLTDWGGLVPALAAGRIDIITGGMYILGDRCEAVNFSDPIAAVGDALIVPAGNPKNLNNYADVATQSAVLAAVAGHNTIAAARQEGVPDANIMQLPGVTELLAAVEAGRADAGVLPALSAARLAMLNPDSIEATDQSAMPEWTLNWVGLGFRPEDDDFRQAFNAALADYLGSEKMMQAAAAFEYQLVNLPGEQTTDWICANR